MALSCNTLCVKYLLFFFNLIFVITGIIIITLGISVKDYYAHYETFIDSRYLYAPEFLISIGILILVISFLGCCGAIRENTCMTLMFSTLLVLIFFLELAAGIGGYYLKTTTGDFLAKKLTNTLESYKINNEVTAAWDAVQVDFKCCGVRGPKDWLHINSTYNQIPMTCCGLPTGGVGGFRCDLNSTTLYQIGCLDLFGDFIREHTYTIEAAGLGIAFLQFVGLTLSCYLTRQIRKGYETV